jgi:hypothetical protein
VTRPRQSDLRSRLGRDAVAALAVLAPAGAAHGATINRFAADAGARMGVSSDPFLTDAPDSASAFVEISITPNYRIDDEYGTTRFRGDLGRTQYLSHYGSSERYGAWIRSERRLREDMELNSELEFDSSILAGPRTVLGPAFTEEPGSEPGPSNGVEPVMPESPPVIEPDEAFEPLDPDLGLAGQRQRRVLFAASTALVMRPSVDENVDLSIRAARARYPGRTKQSNYRSFGGSFGYLRNISPTLSAGLTSSYERTEYDAGGAETDVFQPQATIRGRLNEIWSVDVGLGGLFVRSDTPQGKLRSNGLSATMRGCGVGPRLTGCLGLSRGAFPTGQGNVAKRTGVELVASYQVSETDVVRASGSYTRSSGRLGGVGERSEFVSIVESYERRLSERLVAGVNLQGRLLYAPERTAKDLTVQLLVRVAFGRPR